MKAYLQLFLVCLAALVSFSSCNKDEDSVSNDSFLIGTWSECDSEGFPIKRNQRHLSFSKDKVTWSCELYQPTVMTYTYVGDNSRGIISTTEEGGYQEDAKLTYDGLILEWKWQSDYSSFYFIKD